MWFLFALPIVLGASIPDLYYEHLSNHLDHNVDPCDNFYRHVCPKGAPAPMMLTLQLLTNITKFEHEKAQFSRFEKSKNQLRDFLTSFIGKECVDEETKDEIRCKVLAEAQASTEKDYNKEVEIIALHRHFYANNYTLYKLAHSTENTLQEYFRLLIEEVADDFENTDVTNFYHNSLVAKLKEREQSLLKSFTNLETQAYTMINNFDSANQLMKKMLSQMFSDYTYSFDTSELQQLTTYLDNIKSAVPTIAVEYHFDPQALHNPNKGEAISTNEYTYNMAFMAMQIRNDALKFGAFNYLLGHEINHEYAGPDLIEKSSVFHKKAECVASKFKESCELFKEEGLGCYSEIDVSHDDDTADVSGLRIAYKSFLKYFRDNKSKVTLTTNNGKHSFTNEQLFFYGFGEMFCYDDGSGHHINLFNVPSDHSGMLFRVNTAAREVSGFASAFNCRAGQNMYQEKEKQCVVWGDAPVF